MFNVNSKAAVRKLSRKSFAAAKSRNLIAVLAIALTALLFTALFTVGSGMIENFQRQTMRQAGGDGMGVLKYVTDEQYDRVKGHELIDEISYNRILCDDVLNEEFLKRHAEFYYMDDVGIKLGFCEPVGGHKPVAANEVMMDTRTIKLLGIEPKEGEPVTLKLLVHGKEVERDFVLSGWWEADPAFNVSILVGSRAYVDAHLDELYNDYKESLQLTGVINCYIMFKNSMDLEGKMERVVMESGFSTDQDSPDYIDNNVNWAYLSTNIGMDAPTVAAIGLFLLLIIFAGYLIIYNIFQISVIRDIRFYGLLKTIGTTGKQLRSIIRYQAFVLSCVGIPIGLVAGYLTGCALVPVIMSQSYFAAIDYQVSLNPLIFLGSALFAFAMVLLSTAKPGRVAGRVSPVEALRYTDSGAEMDSRKTRRKGRAGNKNAKKVKKSGYGARIAGMAAANLGRNRKRTVLVVLSMSLSLVLFNTIYTVSLGFDMDKYLSKFVDTDFLAAHADYFRYRFRGPENGTSESLIEAVEGLPGFTEGGRILGNIMDEECFKIEYDGETWEMADDHGNYFCAVYGMEDLPLQRLWVLEGEIDLEKLKSGNYILEGIDLDDYENPEWESSHYRIGDTVTLHNYKGRLTEGEENNDKEYQSREYTAREFTVMAKVAMKYYTNTCGIGHDFNFYLPADVYREMVEVPGIMSYSFNVSDDEEANVEAFLGKYTEEVEPVMGYSSKAGRKGEFESTRNMVLFVGGVLSLVIGLIGVLNFVNSMLTSILTRRREFAMLQSVGMTTSQLRKMLMVEGLYYTAGAGVLSLVLSAAFSGFVMPGMTGGLWFFTHRFTLMPLLATVPVLLALGIILPAGVLGSVTRQSVVERLRETE